MLTQTIAKKFATTYFKSKKYLKNGIPMTPRNLANDFSQRRKEKFNFLLTFV